MSRRVLVASDEPGVLHALTHVLEVRGSRVDACAAAADLVAAVAAAPPDALVLDLALGGIGALEALRRIRCFDDAVPVLAIGGDDGREAAALERGADDVVSHAYAVTELLARLDALRRGGAVRAPVVTGGDLVVDIVARRATRAGSELALTPTQFDLLVCFATRPGRTLTPRMLTAAVWGSPDAAAGGNVRVFVAQLRRRLEGACASAAIVTEPGIGYRFVTRQPTAA